MKLWIECGLSGTGSRFTGSFQDAIKTARKLIRFDGGYNIIWNENNERIAQVWTDHVWIRCDYEKHYCNMDSTRPQYA